MLRCNDSESSYHGNGGYTLIELLVMLSVIGAVVAIMAMTFSEATMITSRDMTQAIAMLQVHQAGNWITKDVAGAYRVTAGSSGTWTCNITSYLFQNGTFTYAYENYTISNGVLKRNGAPVAQNIVNPGTDTQFTQVTPTATENHTYVLTIKAVVNKSGFSQTFKIYQRMPPP